MKVALPRRSPYDFTARVLKHSHNCLINYLNNSRPVLRNWWLLNRPRYQPSTFMEFDNSLACRYTSVTDPYPKIFKFSRLVNILFLEYNFFYFLLSTTKSPIASNLKVEFKILYVFFVPSTCIIWLAYVIFHKLFALTITYVFHILTQ